MSLLEKSLANRTNAMEIVETALALSEKSLQDYKSENSTLQKTLQDSTAKSTEQSLLTTRTNL